MHFLTVKSVLVVSAICGSFYAANNYHSNSGYIRSECVPVVRHVEHHYCEPSYRVEVIRHFEPVCRPAFGFSNHGHRR